MFFKKCLLQPFLKYIKDFSFFRSPEDETNRFSKCIENLENKTCTEETNSLIFAG